jgi:hypothetical protein
LIVLIVVSSLSLAVFLLSEEVVDVTGLEGKGDLTGSAFLSVVDAVTLSKIVVLPKVDTGCCSSTSTVGVGNTPLTPSFVPPAAIVVDAVTLSKIVVLPKVDTGCCCC